MSQIIFYTELVFVIGLILFGIIMAAKMIHDLHLGDGV